jgi:glycosyltransferase involved in cell wall biosynthesis
VRVLHVAQPLDAGVPHAAADLVVDQVGRGFDVAVACPAESELGGRAERAGARRLRWEATRWPGPSLPRELWTLWRIVEETAPEVVHLHSTKAGLVGRLVVRGRLPTVFQPHAWSFLAVEGAVARATLAWERTGARWADVILCVSEDERLIGERAGVRAREFRVVPHGVDPARWPRLEESASTAARQRLGLGGEPLVVCVGRLSRQKDQTALLDVWPAVRARVPGARLVLVGDGPDRGRLEAAAGDGVDLVGRRDDVATWLAAADVVAQPSRWEAGIPLSAVEALACSRTIVFTDAPGLREMARERLGAMVAPGDAGALRDAIIARLAGPEVAAAEGRAGREWVERNDQRQRLEAVSRLYDDLLASRGPGRDPQRTR